MSGYGGPDDHNANIEAVVLNALDVVRANIPTGESAEFCQDDDCGEEIPVARRNALPGVQYCIHCADKHAYNPRIRAVDWIL